MTTEQLYDIIKIQQDEINQLRHELNSLKEWSDMNDYWLREMIDALTETVDSILVDHCCCEKYKIAHEQHKKNREENLN